ncbi:MAG: SDR family NAD(P)-dependent oxidoreductase, partial [Okeania sp. SIO3C4]|nr:SDR family NAD(P)-dependent oxidoreductase [Okeania sp. SIO3C4]
MHESNNTKTDKCIHQLFEEQVDKTPDAVAVAFKQELEIVGTKQRQTWFKGKGIELADIETALLSVSGVEQAYVLAHQTLLVAYVVVSGVWNPQHLHSKIQQQLPPDMIPIALVPLSSLPLTHQGQVDEVALGCFPVIDDNVVQRWEAKLKALPEIEQVAIVVQQKTLKLPPLHLSDLLPSEQIKLPNNGATPVVEKSVPETELQTQSTSGKLAISEGEPIKWSPNAPTTLAQALERAAQNYGDTSLIYIQSDGEVITQTYSDLWVEAQRILGGLRQLGLKPTDKVIFQLESNQDFISTFWGCVLGGFVPVPVSIPPSYDQSHSSLTKLENTWQMLGQPLILTDNKLASSVRGWSQRLNLGKSVVETLEQLRGFAPDTKIYKSQPQDLAVLLLTSGSTGIPKAVMQENSKLLSMSAGTIAMNQFSSQDVTLNWMPMDHVGALVFMSIMAVDLGCQQIHVPTQLILQHPLKWLDLIDCYQATISWAPNFAFTLIGDRAAEVRKRYWDLSSMKFLVNAGEAIVTKTARNFLKLLSSYGLSTKAIHPAFGMCETCSGITWSNSFSLESSSDEDKFVELGPPITGTCLRIVDTNQQVVGEEVVGFLQVKGASVTSGYYQNSTANKEAFTADGWFNTGDLGFLKNGSLTITGRQKDVIIINGLNYYSHEIESVVEELPEIEVSYTAACAVREVNGNTDKLGIFFNSEKAEDTELLVLLKNIREQVVKRMGINPDYLIPLDKELIPKTSIGKIQRTQLSQRFAKGEFKEILKRVDLITENNNTIPDWFYQKIWRRKQGNYQPQKLAKNEVFLVFLDKLGLGEKFCQKLENNSQPYVQIELGETFKKINYNHYIIAPDLPENYQQLYQSLATENLKVGAIIHLWHYDKSPGEITDTETLETAQKTGIYSLLFLLQTFGNQNQNYPLRLLYVANNSQSLNPKEPIAYQKATVRGLLKTIPQENPQWHCRHLDLPQNSLEVNSDRILEELTIDAKDSQVAYRDGQRWVLGIEKIDLPSKPKQPLPFKTGGTYLISGGLGGIGVEIAKYLLEHYQAKLLLLGRTALPDSNSWETYLQQGGKLAEKIKAYQQLQKLGGEVIYQGVDIANQKAVQEVVQQTLSGWNTQQLDGVIHLAGLMQERLLREETPESFAEVLRPKLLGTWVLHQLLELQPQSLFINFSSINGFFGGTTVGVYAAANSFLDAFSDYQRYQGQLQSYCLAWSMWDEMGMSRGYQMKQLTQAKGYLAVGLSQGMSSLLAGLYHDQPYLMVGLDASNLNIRRFTTVSDTLQQLTAYFTTNDKGKPNVSVLERQVEDAVGKPSSCAVVE